MEKVFNHSNYRTFLRAFAQNKRKAQPNWTLGIWARDLKLKATTSLTMVLNGQRHPGPKMTTSLSEYFKFNSKERLYFEDLVRLEKIKDDSHLKVLIMEELKRLSPKKAFELLDENTFAVISNWYCFALRAALRVPGFNQNRSNLKRQFLFEVSEKELDQALQALLKTGLIKLKGAKYVATEHFVNTSDDIASEAIKRFHENMLDLSKRGVRRFQVEEREYRSQFILMNMKQMVRAKELIREFVRNFDELMESNHADAEGVYALNVQFLPLIEVKK